VFGVIHIAFGVLAGEERRARLHFLVGRSD
jgi:hypothetical protein